jgi:hypothetical protein
MKEDKMAKQKKVPGKAKKDPNNNRKHTIEADGPNEVNVEIELLDDDNYEVEKLEMGGLPQTMPAPNNAPIRWFNNFSIKKGGNPIKKKYKVKIPGLASKLAEKNSRLVIYSETQGSNPYYYNGTISGDTFELEDGDPANGMSP